MDTDDLTPMAYETVSRAFNVHDALRAVIGASAMDYRSEDEFLKGTLKDIEELIEDPEDYLDLWDPDEETDTADFVEGLGTLREHVIATLSTPYEARGKPPFAKD